MKKDFSDEKLDRILERLVKDSMLSEDAIDEIASSPKIWQNVHREIRREKADRRKGWLPVFEWRIAAFASLTLIFCAGLVWLLNAGQNPAIVEVKPLAAPVVEIPEIADRPENEPPKDDSKFTANSPAATRNSSNKTVFPKREVKTNLVPKLQLAKTSPKTSPNPVLETEEIKSDFIALNYSSAPESGQLVKVKVPRAMMVSLGVSNKVENNAEYVNAEVLMSHDGTAQAIRFIQ